jgi:DNA-binding winged helix-turn-helix (wHTH) protein/tetratricopeptide (TPR) repeat protein
VLSVGEDGPHCYEFGPFRLDSAQRALLRDGEPVPLPPKALDILLLLVRNPGRLITKEELLTAIWPKMVVEESNLSQNIFLLRKALGDGAPGHRYIVTLPRRGYQFAESVRARPMTVEARGAAPILPPQAGEAAVDAAAHPVRPSAMRPFLIPAIAGTIIAVVLIIIAGSGHWSRPPVMADSDTIILADFANSTGDPVFDGTLRQALAAQLEQSPLLNLLSDQRIATTLALMGRPKDAPISAQLAGEVCQRTGSAVVIDGSIAQLGTQYLLALKASNCRSGDTLGHAQAQASDKNHVLDALGIMASSMRSKLGESLSSVQKYDAPPEEVTTPSLEALQAYSLGYRTMIRNNDYPAAIPLFQRAIVLDPTFAMAHARLGINYFNLGEPARAEDSLKKAYDLRDRLSKREQLYVTASYNAMALRDFATARQSYELWAQIYPRDQFAVGNLGVVYGYLGEYDKSLAAIRKAWALNSQNALVYANIVDTLLKLNRLDEAKEVATKAKTLGLESQWLHAHLYTIDFLQHDRAGMEREASELADKPGWGDVVLDAQANTAAYEGRFGQASELTRRAIEAAERDDKQETAAAYQAEAAVREAFVGNNASAIRQARAALALSHGKTVQTLAAIALGVGGDPSQAERLANELAHNFPQDTVFQFNAVPSIRAAVALSSGNPAQAIEVLQIAQRYALGQTDEPVGFTMYPVYLRAQAYAAVHRPEAVGEFQRILDHPGIVQNELIAALAHLGLARAYAAANDNIQARAAYNEFLTLWKGADQDLPILKSAELEQAKLL